MATGQVTAMTRVSIPAILLGAALASACTGFERTSSNVLAPSPASTTSTTTASPAPAPAPAPSGAPSMLGTWSSNPLADISATACTGLSWQVTSQTTTSIAGTFSATCANGISASGTASGQINGSDVPYTVSGTGTLPGFPSCAFSISGTAHIVDNNTLEIPYSGTTCLGPVSGSETLRRPTAPAPSEPAPPADPGTPPPPPPPPSESTYHVQPGPKTLPMAEQVVNATADEFRHLVAPRNTSGEAQDAAEELLRRVIWHLRHYGFDAGRQKNPSGAISGDKLTVFAEGGWHAIDIFYVYGSPGKPIRMIFLEVFPASPVADGGIPD